MWLATISLKHYSWIDSLKSKLYQNIIFINYILLGRYELWLRLRPCLWLRLWLCALPSSFVTQLHTIGHTHQTHTTHTHTHKHHTHKHTHTHTQTHTQTHTHKHTQTHTHKHTYCKAKQTSAINTSNTCEAQIISKTNTRIRCKHQCFIQHTIKTP